MPSRLIVPPALALALSLGAIETLNAQLRVTGSIPVLSGRAGSVTLSGSVGPAGTSVAIGGRARSTSGSASTSGRAPTTTRGSERVTSARIAGALASADRHVGVRYVYGGSTPAQGFDCSGFVQYLFAEQGVSLPRTSREQATVGRVATGALRPGDLIFFATGGSRVDHVAIYAGGGRIIHSSSSGGGVLYDDLDSRRGRWFMEHHVATRRLVE